MILSLSATLALAATCAPQVAPQTLMAIVQVESGFDPLAIGVNGAPGLRPRPRSATQAAAMARDLIAAGRSIDLGLAQLNHRNLPRLGLSLDEAFDPCRNLTAAATLLAKNYALSRPRHPDAQAALRAAISLYNTGSQTRGLANGYVARVQAAAGVPASGPAAPRSSLPTPEAATPDLTAPDLTAPPATWDVFARARSGGLLVRPIPLGGPS